jgi:hypothetical protein
MFPEQMYWRIVAYDDAQAVRRTPRLLDVLYPNRT